MLPPKPSAGNPRFLDFPHIASRLQLNLSLLILILVKMA